MENIKTFFEDIIELLKLLFETIFQVKAAEDIYNQLVDNLALQIIFEYKKYIIIGLSVIIIYILIRILATWLHQKIVK